LEKGARFAIWSHDNPFVTATLAPVRDGSVAVSDFHFGRCCALLATMLTLRLTPFVGAVR
jgi:hypothetical protein